LRFPLTGATLDDVTPAWGILARPRTIAFSALSILLTIAAPAVARTYTGGAVTIADSPLPSSPYPSTVTSTGEGSIVLDVSVKLLDFTHTFPEDVDILLVAPSGAGVVLMSDAGGTTAVVNKDPRFSDTGLFPMGEFVSNTTYTPTDIDDGDDVFPSPAPAGPFGTSLDALGETQPNGQWSLYVVDDDTDETGSIAGWELRIHGHAPTPTTAQLVPLMTGGGYEEWVGSARLEISRFGNEMQAGGFAYSVVPGVGGPTPGEDYTPVSGRLDWAVGEFSSKTIEVPILDDALPEGQECFEFAFSDVSGDVAPPSKNSSQVCLAPSDGFGVPPAPVSRLGGAAVQRVLKQGGVAVTAGTNVAVTATATGTITVARQAAAVVRLIKVRRPVAAGRTVKLKLGLSRKARATLRRAFLVKPRLKAVVRLTTKDFLGRTSSTLKRITLKR